MSTKQSATETYKERLARARTMLTTLSLLLDEHERRQADRPDNWGFAGDLGWVVERVGEISAFLANGR